MATWRTFRVSVELRVPLSFAYAWCTEYTPEDGRYSGEDRTIHLQRRIIERDPQHVVFENLYDEGRGWGWEHHRVTLLPPNRWHCEGNGNYQQSILDYTLTKLSGDRTRFDMRWRSRPIGLAQGARPLKPAVEAYVTKLWTRRARALERDYSSSTSVPTNRL